jgi:hypothetical protein
MPLTITCAIDSYPSYPFVIKVGNSEKSTIQFGDSEEYVYAECPWNYYTYEEFNSLGLAFIINRAFDETVYCIEQDNLEAPMSLEQQQAETW